VDVTSNFVSRAKTQRPSLLLTLILGLGASLSLAPLVHAQTEDPDGDALSKTLMGQFAGTDYTPRRPQVYLAKGLQGLVGGSIGIVSNTGSMVPALRYNDVAIVLTVKTSEVRVGDIVVYHGFDAQGKALPVIHRVITLEPGGASLHVKGDANPIEDATLVTDQNIIGRVKYVVQADTCQIRDYSISPAGELTTYRRLAAVAEAISHSASTVYAEQ